MKRVVLILLMFLVIGCTKEVEKTIQQKEKPIGGDNMKLISNDFEHGGMIPARFTCQGEDINPHLKWDDVLEGVKSFALLVDDPDAPMGTWKHWLVVNIGKDVREIAQNSVPSGSRQIRNDFGKEDYGGPCPPSGVHRYMFKLYALDVEILDADESNLYDEVEKHKVEEAVLMGKYTKT